jgi:hypothetical protein
LALHRGRLACVDFRRPGRAAPAATADPLKDSHLAAITVQTEETSEHQLVALSEARRSGPSAVQARLASQGPKRSANAVRVRALPGFKSPILRNLNRDFPDIASLGESLCLRLTWPKVRIMSARRSAAASWASAYYSNHARASKTGRNSWQLGWSPQRA